MVFKKSNRNILAWWHKNDGNFNFGDELNPYLIKKISNKSVKRVGKIPRFAFSKINICIGSVIIVARASCNVWGAGIIEKSAMISKSNYFAVRGKYTQKRMAELGITPPETIGDPALLLPLYYNPGSSTKFDYGITPHIVDYEHVQKHTDTNTVSVIDFTQPNIEEIIDAILACGVIVSSSLHGIIVANAYNKPAIWVKFSNKLYGDDIKFYDYFSSVGVDESITPVEIDPTSFDFTKLFEISQKNLIRPDYKIISQIQQNLLDVCPFK
jgi:hypothetical protein